jgi:hypothetical protein
MREAQDSQIISTSLQQIANAARYLMDTVRCRVRDGVLLHDIRVAEAVSAFVTVHHAPVFLHAANPCRRGAGCGKTARPDLWELRRLLTQRPGLAIPAPLTAKLFFKQREEQMEKQSSILGEQKHNAWGRQPKKPATCKPSWTAYSIRL